MERVSLSRKMAVSTGESGKMVKLMVMVSFSILTNRLYMKGTGLKTNSMAKD